MRSYRRTVVGAGTSRIVASTITPTWPWPASSISNSSLWCRRRAVHDVAVAGDRLQGDDVVDLGAGAEGHGTDPADRQRAADGLADVVGQHGRHQPCSQRRRQDRVPAAPGTDGDAAVDDRPDVVERRQVEHDRRVVLRLPEHRVGGAAADDADPVAAGEAEHSRDVLDRAGAQHGDRLLADDLAEVLGVGAAGGVVEEQRAVEARHLVERRGRAAVSRRRDPGAEAAVEPDDGRAGDGLHRGTCERAAAE